MGVLRCCECSKKAAIMVEKKYYCDDCVPTTVSKPETHEPAVIVEEVEEPKKKRFWEKVIDWFNKYEHDCRDHYFGGF